MMYPALVIDDLRSFDFNDPRCPYTDSSAVTYVRNLEDAQEKIFDHKNVHIQDLWLDFDLGGDLTGDQIMQAIVACAIYDLGSITVDRVLIVSQNPDGQRILAELAREICNVVNMHVPPVMNALISAPIPEGEVIMGTEFTPETEETEETSSASEQTSEETTTED